MAGTKGPRYEPFQRHAGHVVEMTTPDTHRILLDYVYTYGANFKIRLVYNHIIVVTEVGCCRSSMRPELGPAH